MRTLRELLVLGLVAAFVLVYGDFMLDIWRARAGSGEPPRFNDGLVTFAGALAGVLGTGFTVALGIEKRTSGRTDADTPDGTRSAGRGIGRSTRFKSLVGVSPSVTIGIWAYAVVGAAAAVTTLVNLEETPDPIKALSSVFVGYILALASTAFGAIRPS